MMKITNEYMRDITNVTLESLVQIDTMESRAAHDQLHRFELDRRALQIALHATNRAILELLEGIREEILNK